MRQAILILGCSLPLFLPLRWFRPRANQPPPAALIEQAYFACDKCGTLSGGIFGKGPTKRLDGPGRKTCVHAWKRVTREEFKRRATQVYGVNWEKEIPYWRR